MKFIWSPFPLIGSELSFLAILPSEDEVPASCHVGNDQHTRGVEHISTQLRPSPSIIRTGRELRKDTLPVLIPSKPIGAHRACPSSWHSVWKVLQLGGEGGSHSRTNQPHLRNHLSPLGLSVPVCKMGRRPAALEFCTYMEGSFYFPQNSGPRLQWWKYRC